MKELVDKHQDRLFGIAYRMLGSVTDAEDAVQEAFARYAASEDIDDPAGWLTTVVTNVSIDALRSARRRRETYVGPWLPEPLLTHERDPSELAEVADSLTLAFLTVLERLSPSERAVFLLHDVFGYPHAQIAAMLHRSDAAVRKLASRARARLAEGPTRYEQDAGRRHQVANAFLDAASGADLDRLMGLLAPDVVFTSDGGGVVSAARRPVHGADRVARLLLALVDQARDEGWTLTAVEINGQPGLVAEQSGDIDTAVVLHVHDARVTAIYAIRNPDKLDALRRQMATSQTMEGRPMGALPRHRHGPQSR